MVYGPRTADPVRFPVGTAGEQPLIVTSELDVCNGAVKYQDFKIFDTDGNNLIDDPQEGWPIFDATKLADGTIRAYATTND